MSRACPCVAYLKFLFCAPQLAPHSCFGFKQSIPPHPSRRPPPAARTIPFWPYHTYRPKIRTLTVHTQGAPCRVISTQRHSPSAPDTPTPGPPAHAQHHARSRRAIARAPSPWPPIPALLIARPLRLALQSCPPKAMPARGTCPLQARGARVGRPAALTRHPPRRAQAYRSWEGAGVRSGAKKREPARTVLHRPQVAASSRRGHSSTRALLGAGSPRRLHTRAGARSRLHTRACAGPIVEAFRGDGVPLPRGLLAVSVRVHTSQRYCNNKGSVLSAVLLSAT